MLTPPDGLRQDDLRAALTSEWGLTATSMTYLPVGFGSHHWQVADAAGGRWFVTADELDAKRVVSGEPVETAFKRLSAALATAVRLKDCGAEFVVAPVPARSGAALARVAGRFGIAVYPLIRGQGFSWGEFRTAEHRLAVLRLVVAVHTAPEAARSRAMAEDYVIPHRDELESALASRDVPERGPYSRSTSALIAGNAGPIRRLLASYDELASLSRAEPSRMVLTHGEPHPGNTMRAADGWRMVDWDTVLIAQPERDLWSLDPGDGSILDAYAEATGVRPDSSALELYRLRWDLGEIAVDVSRFSGRHAGSLDDDKTWDGLRSTVEGACA